MTSYVEQVLTRDERIVHIGHISLWSLSLYIVGGLVLLPAFGIGLLLWIVAYVKYKTTELAITNKRVIAKFGFIKRDTLEINLNQVEALRVEQTFLGRMLNYGTIIVSGTGGALDPFPNIADPLVFRRKFMEATSRPLSREART